MKRTCLILMAAFLLLASPGQAQTRRDADQTNAAVMSLCDPDMIKEFRSAWQRAAGGARAVEAVILVVGNRDGSCKATLAPATNEYRHLRFRWQPGTIAIVHTHPNRDDPRPSPADTALAERFHVPMFTLTVKGMFLYDPATKVVSRVQPGIDWMDAAKWTRDAPVLVISR